VAALVAINLRGVRTGARVLEAITLFKLLPLLLFVVIGVFFVKPSNLAWTNVPDISTVLGSAGIIIFAFSGIEGATVPSGEVKNISRTVPLAILLAIGGITLLYLAIQFVALGIMGVGLANTGRTPLAEAAGVILGPTARTVMIAAAIVSMFGYLSANMLSEPRGLFAMSRDGFLPSALKAVHPRFRTPNVAIVVYGSFVLLFALLGSFEWLTRFSNLAALSLYFLCAASTLRLRRLNVRGDGDPFVIPGGPLVPVLACIAVVWLGFETVLNEAEGGLSQLYALIVVIGIILALYALRRLKGERAVNDS
jgi:amino acid transporter